MEIKEIIHSGEMVYKGNRVLIYELSTLSSKFKSEGYNFEKYNSEQFNLLFGEIKGELYKRSVGQFNVMERSNCFIPFEIRSSTDVLYNSNNIISAFTDIFYFVGAEGCFMKRQSQTWDKRKEKLCSLSWFFAVKSWQEQLFSIIEPQVINFEAEMGIPCFPEWKKHIFDSMSKNRFYLTMDGIVVYIPQGYITSNIWGIPTFLIKYIDIKNIMRISLD